MSNQPKFQLQSTVTVDGYGGAATILNVEQDGFTPQGSPKWLYTVTFGAFAPTNYNTGTTTNFNGKKNGQTLKPGTPGANNPLHKFYQGRLHDFYKPADPDIINEIPEIPSDDPQELLQRLAELEAEILGISL